MGIMFVSSKMKSADYVKVLDECLKPFMRQNRGQQLIFQQDNASIHVSAETRRWLNSNNIDVLDWPACSPDLNPIENIWGHLARAIYAENKQYESIAELKKAIKTAWNHLRLVTLKNHSNSMSNRLFQVIRRNGGSSDY